MQEEGRDHHHDQDAARQIERLNPTADTGLTRISVKLMATDRTRC